MALRLLAGLVSLLLAAPAHVLGEAATPALCANLMESMLVSKQCSGILSSVVQQPNFTCTLSAFGACFEQGRDIPEECSPDQMIDYDPPLAATL